MRRNILRRTLSEDLKWADCIKNDPNFRELQSIGKTSRRQQFPLGMESRSLRSTPERRHQETYDQYTTSKNGESNLKSAGKWLVSADQKNENQATPLKTEKMGKKSNGKAKRKDYKGGQASARTSFNNSNSSSFVNAFSHQQNQTASSFVQVADNRKTDREREFEDHTASHILNHLADSNDIFHLLD